ncbi:MAG: hypothetical protein M3015_00245 [Bacteroidota bacterium]|nr:hypothetical protein [Bacteroidota bacterium]
MKIFTKALLLCTIVCYAFTSNAQILSSNKTSLFAGVAPSFKAAISELDKAFLAKEGSVIQLQFSNNFVFSGTIMSSVQRYGKLSSIIVKSPSLQNTLLSLSKRTNEDNTITYVGRILNGSYADGYELNKNTDGTYTFNKVKSEDLLQDY